MTQFGKVKACPLLLSKFRRTSRHHSISLRQSDAHHLVCDGGGFRLCDCQCAGRLTCLGACQAAYQKTLGSNQRGRQLKLVLSLMGLRPVPELANGQPITISTFSYKQLRVEVREEQVESRTRPVRYVFVEGLHVGEYDKWCGLPLEKLPMECGSITMTLSTGEAVELHERELVVITKWNQGVRRFPEPWQRDWYYFPEKTSLWQSRTTLNPWSEITWAQLSELPLGKIVGAPVGVEFPFQWVDDCLTNGDVSFPRGRPTGAEWRDYPIYAVPAKGWEFFLKTLETRFLRELIPVYQRACSVAAEAEADERSVPEAEDRAKLRRVIEGKMWTGCSAAKRIAVGSAVVTIVPRPEPLGTAYVVDNPDVGALYFFATYEEARDLASGLMPRSEIRPTQLHVDHNPGWESEVDHILDKVPASCFAGTPKLNGVAKPKTLVATTVPKPPTDPVASAVEGQRPIKTKDETPVASTVEGLNPTHTKDETPVSTEESVQRQTRAGASTPAVTPPSPTKTKGGAYSLLVDWGPPK